jgi:hypothetical protein
MNRPARHWSGGFLVKRPARRHADASYSVIISLDKVIVYLNMGRFASEGRLKTPMPDGVSFDRGRRINWQTQGKDGALRARFFAVTNQQLTTMRLRDAASDE